MHNQLSWILLVLPTNTTKLWTFKASDPRQVPQERSNLATYGNRDIKSLVEHFRNDYLTEAEETSIISMWPALRTRLVRQKAITQIMYSVALTSLPQDLTTSRPAYFYWTSCSPQLHQQQSVSQVSLQWTTQNTLSDLMQMCSSDHAMKAYRPNSAITNWFSGDTFFYLN